MKKLLLKQPNSLDPSPIMIIEPFKSLLKNWMVGIFLGGHKLCNFSLRVEEKLGICMVPLRNKKISNPSFELWEAENS